MKKIVAISGGENGRLLEDGTFAKYETGPMDVEIVKLTNKENPHLLFLAHAMSFSLEIQESYFYTIKKIYEKLGCSCKILKTTELSDLDKLREMFEWADIIYEGGGDTGSMISLWKKYRIDTLLVDAWNNGKVICGVSAGAVCWFNSCNSDMGLEDKMFEEVSCLNWINLFLVPHCNEDGRYESSKSQLKENNLIGLLMSNCSAIEIIDDKYRIIVSDATSYGFKKGYAYKAYWLKGKYYEEKIKATNEFLPLNDLLTKNIIIKD